MEAVEVVWWEDLLLSLFLRSILELPPPPPPVFPPVGAEDTGEEGIFMAP